MSSRQSAEISEEERRYENGEMSSVLDVVRIPILEAKPNLHQSENYLIDSEYYWVKEGELPWSELGKLIDKSEPLWANNDSTYYGFNDRVKTEIASNFSSSLYTN